MRPNRLIAGCVALSSLALVANAAGTGQINGSVVDQAGKPLASATVAALVRPPAVPTDPFVSFYAEVATGSDGKFTITAVPPGRFAVCASVSNRPLLPSCGWGNELIVTVAANQTVTLQPIQLNAGVDLYIRVNDPNGTRSSTEGKVAGASLLLAVGLAKGGGGVPIPMTGADGKGFDHHLAVPPDTDLTLQAYSGFYSLGDASGTPIDPRGLVQAIRIATSEGQHQVILNIK